MAAPAGRLGRFSVPSFKKRDAKRPDFLRRVRSALIVEHLGARKKISILITNSLVRANPPEKYWPYSASSLTFRRASRIHTSVVFRSSSTEIREYSKCRSFQEECLPRTCSEVSRGFDAASPTKWTLFQIPFTQGRRASSGGR